MTEEPPAQSEEPTPSPTPDAADTAEPTETVSPTESAPVVTQTPPAETETAWIICAEDGVYEITEATEDVYMIGAEHVTLILRDVTIRDTQIQARVRYTLLAQGEVRVIGDEALALADIRADSLQVSGTLAATSRLLGGRVVVSRVPQGQVTVQANVQDLTELYVMDEASAILALEDGTLLLPELPENSAYLLEKIGSALYVRVTEAFEDTFDAKDTEGGLNLGNLQHFHVIGSGQHVTGSISVRGASAAALFDHVLLYSDGPVLTLENEQLSIDFVGDSALVSTSRVLSLSGSSALSLNVMSGRLVMQQQESLEGVSLKGNIKIVPEPEGGHVTVRVLNRTGQAVANRNVRVRIGDKTYQWITHYDGTLSLWGMDLDGTELTVSDGTETLLFTRTPSANVYCHAVSDVIDTSAFTTAAWKHNRSDAEEEAVAATAGNTYVVNWGTFRTPDRGGVYTFPGSKLVFDKIGITLKSANATHLNTMTNTWCMNKSDWWVSTPRNVCIGGDLPLPPIGDYAVRFCSTSQKRTLDLYSELSGCGQLQILGYGNPAYGAKMYTVALHAANTNFHGVEQIGRAHV